MMVEVQYSRKKEITTEYDKGYLIIWLTIFFYSSLFLFSWYLWTAILSTVKDALTYGVFFGIATTIPSSYSFSRNSFTYTFFCPSF